MKAIIQRLALAFLATVWAASPLLAADMRELQIQAREAKEALMRQAAAEKEAADQAAAESRARIIQDRTALDKAISGLESANHGLRREVKELTAELRRLEDTEQQLTQKLAQTDRVIQELVGVIRINAKDIDALIAQNLQTALGPAPSSFLEAIAEESRFPGMEDVRAMAGALLNQIRSSGEVLCRKGMVVDRTGREVEADILVLGPFTAAYRIGHEVGFLNHSSAGTKLYALSRLPSGRMQSRLTQYMEGQSETVPMDISRGGALRQLTHELSLWEQIPKGGPIVWPILVVLAAGALIVVERTFFLVRKRLDSDGLIHRIEALSAENNWQACTQACAEYAQKPVARVMQAGLLCCHMQREEMEKCLAGGYLERSTPYGAVFGHTGNAGRHRPAFWPVGDGHRHDRYVSRDYPARHWRPTLDVRRDLRGPGDHHAGALRGNPAHAVPDAAEPCGRQKNRGDGRKGRGPGQYRA
jgi:biopolymer transport protein ExbB